MRSIKINSEAEAIQFLQDLDNGRTLDIDGPPQIEFGDWVNLHIYLPNTPIEGSISPTMMKAFLELQEAINRTYKLLDANTADLRTLTQTEKDVLEFRVKVEKGSSDYSVELIKVVEKIGLEAITKMPPEMIAIIAVTSVLIISSTVVLKGWLKNRSEERIKQIESEPIKQMLETHKDLMKEAMHGANVVNKLIENTPILKEIAEVNSAAKEQIVKAVGIEGGGTIAGTNISPEIANELSTSTRNQSHEIFLKGNFRILKVDTSIADGFSVRLLNEKDGYEITASLVDAIISADHKAIIQQAEWSKTSVWLELKAKRLHDKYIDAVVVDAKAKQDEKDNVLNFERDKN